MNKLVTRRKRIMEKRSAQPLQRKQNSLSFKKQLAYHRALFNFTFNRDHTMAKIARKIMSTTTKSNRYTRIANWHRDHPELSKQMKAYMKKALHDFMKMKKK